MTRPTSPLGDPFPSKQPPASRRRSSARASAAFEASFARGLDLSNLASSSPPTAPEASPSTAQPPPSAHAHQSASARLLAAKALEVGVAEDEQREERLLEERVELRIRQHRSGRGTATTTTKAGDEFGGRNLRFSAPAATLPPPPSRSGSDADRDGGSFASSSSSWNGSLGAAVVSMHDGDRAGANRERGGGGRTRGGGKLVRRNAIVKRRRSGLASGVPSSARGCGGGGGAKFHTKKHVNVARRSGLGTMKRRTSSSS